MAQVGEPEGAIDSEHFVTCRAKSLPAPFVQAQCSSQLRTSQGIWGNRNYLAKTPELFVFSKLQLQESIVARVF